MTRTVALRLGDGRGEILIEVDDTLVAPTGTKIAASTKALPAIDAQVVLDQLASFLQLAHARFEQTLRIADQFQIEVGAKLSASGSVVIAKAGGESSMKIRMRWNKTTAGRSKKTARN